MSAEPLASSVPDRLVKSAINLLAEQGPSAIKARTVAAGAGLSTMVVYSHFGGIPELLRAVGDEGFADLERQFARVQATDDPISDLFTLALVTRQMAQANPHLYDLMFGLSVRATYRPLPEGRSSGHSPAFQAAYAHLVDACGRLVQSGRVGPADPEVLAAALWSYVHGFITLELADHFAQFKDPVSQVFVPMGTTFCVGLGDDPDRARASHEAAARNMKRKFNRP